MNLKLPLMCAVSVALLSLADPVSAVEPAVRLPAVSEASLAGLHVSLTTSGYKFFVDEDSAEQRSRDSFVASVLVANRSNTDIPFIFPTPAAAEAKWTFRIFNSAGEELWRSDSDVISAQVLVEETLEKRARWKRLLHIPLRVNGKALPAGLYTLEASIDADKPLRATALFEVVPEPLSIRTRPAILRPR